MTTSLIRTLCLAWLVLSGALLAPTSQAAQPSSAAWPAKPLRVLLPAAPGTAVDTATRVIFAKVGESLGKPVVIENKPGADGMIAAAAAAKASRDGHDFFVSNAGVFTINPSYRSQLAYDPERDFTPISQLTTAVLVVSVRPGLQAATLRELIAQAKAHPGRLTYSSSTGRSGIAFLSMELLKQRAGAAIEWVGYKDDSQALADLLGGRIDIFVDALATSLPYAKTGKLQILAVTGSRTAQQIPDVKTIADSGYPGVSGDAWIGLFAPSGVSPDIIRRMEAEVAQALKDPAIRSRLQELGLDPVGSDAAQLAARVKEDREKWSRLIQELGLKP